MNLREQLKQIQFRELAKEPDRALTLEAESKVKKALQDLAVDNLFATWAALIVLSLAEGVRPVLVLDPFRIPSRLAEALEMHTWTSLNIGLLKEEHPYHQVWRAFQDELLSQGVVATLVYVPATVELCVAQLPRYAVELRTV